LQLPAEAAAFSLRRRWGEVIRAARIRRPIDVKSSGRL
jgi:hypothetical protein